MTNTKNPISTTLTYDHTTDNVVQRRQQDVQPLLELNRKEINGDIPVGNTVGKDMRKVASIPLIVIEMWKSQYGVDIFNKNDMPKIKQLLNSPDWHMLRTSEGKI
jgi:hypothetical protein